MKNTFKYAWLILLSVGCSNALQLDEEAFDFISPDNFYKTEKDANASCIGLYSEMDRIEIYHVFNGLGSVGLTRNGNYNYQNAGDINERDDLMRRVWQFLFETVRKANTTIYYLEQSEMPDEVKNRYIAEAKAIRAFTYFRLVRLWGDIPMRLTPIVETDDFPLTSFKDVYLQVIDDLESAIPLLWNRGEKPEGRMNKSAGQLILADVYLTLASSARSYDAATSAKGLKPYYDAFGGQIQEFYEQAKAWSTAVIDGPYTLLPNWMDLWGTGPGFDNRFNNEFIWASQTASGLYGHGFGDHYSPIYSHYTPASRTLFLGVTYQHVVSFDTDDIRYKDGLIWEYQDVDISAARNQVVIQRWRRHVDDPDYPASTSGSVIIKRTADSLIYENKYWEMCTKKFFDMTYTVESVGPVAVMPYYRMAEAYLIYAEAENELNGMTQLAVDKINAIRERVNLSPYVPAAFSKEEFRGRILDERLWEFTLEGKDYFDLIRMGQLEERCYGVEVNRFGKDNVENPRPRDADDYWLPYPLLEKGLNTFLEGKDRMNYQ